VLFIPAPDTQQRVVPATDTLLFIGCLTANKNDKFHLVRYIGCSWYRGTEGKKATKIIFFEII